MSNKIDRTSTRRQGAPNAMLLSVYRCDRFFCKKLPGARLAQSRRHRTNRAAVIGHGDVPPLYAVGQPHGARSIEPEPHVRGRRDAKIEAQTTPPRRGARHCFPCREPSSTALIDGHTGVTLGQTVRAAVAQQLRTDQRRSAPEGARPGLEPRLVRIQLARAARSQAASSANQRALVKLL